MRRDYSVAKLHLLSVLLDCMQFKSVTKNDTGEGQETRMNKNPLWVVQVKVKANWRASTVNIKWFNWIENRRSSLKIVTDLDFIIRLSCRIRPFRPFNRGLPYWIQPCWPFNQGGSLFFRLWAVRPWAHRLWAHCRWAISCACHAEARESGSYQHFDFFP